MAVLNYNIDDVPAIKEHSTALTEGAKKKKKILVDLKEDFAAAGQTKIVASIDALITSAETEIKNAESYEEANLELCKKIEAMTEAMQG